MCLEFEERAFCADALFDVQICSKGVHDTFK